MENRKRLIILNTIRDIQIAMLRKRKEGLIINEEIINEILLDIEVQLKEQDSVDDLIDLNIKSEKEKDL